MQTRQFTRFPGLALAVLLTLLVGSVGADDRKLEGTWDVTLKCTKDPFDSACSKSKCEWPVKTPDDPITTLNTFLKGGGMLWSATFLFVGPGQGSWERLGDHQFMAHFKFYVFDLSTGFPIRYEKVTQVITLTGRDTYTGTMTYDLFDIGMVKLAEDCGVNISATRVEFE